MTPHGGPRAGLAGMSERIAGAGPASPATFGRDLSPPERDQLAADAGRSLRWTAPRQKHVAYTLGVSEPQVSRWCNGREPNHIARTHETVRALVREGRTDAGSLIASFMATAEEEAIRLPSDEIRRRFLECCAQETLEQASEDVATQQAIVAVMDNGQDMRARLEAQEEALIREGGREIETVIYNRALRVVRGWRVAPGAS